MNTIKKITSFTIHTTGEGQRISYTYSIVDSDTGSIISENNRENIVVLDGIESNNLVLQSIADIKSYISVKMEGES